MNCSKCGAKTIGWMITVQGGSRVRDIAGLHSRGIKCKGCADARIAEMNKRDREKARKQ